MSKYICVEDFANELKDFCCKPCKENGEDKEGYQCGSCSVMYLVGAVDAFPAADVEPIIHAKWVYDDNHHEYYCSNCEFSKEYVSPYCDYCGAKMDKE